MVALWIIGCLLVVIAILLVISYLMLCWYSIPYEEYVRYQRELIKIELEKKERKKVRREKWKQLRRKLLSFWRSWKGKA